MLWWYPGPISRVESLDVIGVGSSLDLGNVGVYELLSIVLFSLAMIGRKRQIKLRQDGSIIVKYRRYSNATPEHIRHPQRLCDARLM